MGDRSAGCKRQLGFPGVRRHIRLYRAQRNWKNLYLEGNWQSDLGSAATALEGHPITKLSQNREKLESRQTAVSPGKSERRYVQVRIAFIERSNTTLSGPGLECAWSTRPRRCFLRSRSRLLKLSWAIVSARVRGATSLLAVSPSARVPYAVARSRWRLTACRRAVVVQGFITSARAPISVSSASLKK